MKLLRVFTAGIFFSFGTCALSLGFISFGYSLQTASSNYAQGQRMDTLKALYSSVDWASVVEAKDRKLKATEKKLEVICKKSRKACL